MSFQVLSLPASGRGVKERSHDASEHVILRHLPLPRGCLAERACHRVRGAEASEDALMTECVLAWQAVRIVEGVKAQRASQLLRDTVHARFAFA